MSDGPPGQAGLSSAAPAGPAAPAAPAAGVASWPRRLWRSVLAVPLALWVFLEEWVWNHVLAVTAWVARLPPVRWVEAQIAKLPPYAALVAFSIPAIILLPFKLAAFWLIAHGHAIYGMWVFIVAKLVGTAFLARIFVLTKPALMTIAWFARAYGAFSRWKERLYAYVRALPAYQRIKAQLAQLRATWRAWWRERASR
jgi:hypothetical protein